MIDLSVIIVSFNTKKLTEACIDSVVENTKGIKYEIIVIDNGSDDGSRDILMNYSRDLASATRRPSTKVKDSVAQIRENSCKPSIRLIKNRTNKGFGKANNQGIKVAKGKYLLLLNSDTVVKDNVLGEMVSWMDKHVDVGIASCALRNPDGSMQGTGGYFPTLLRVFSWMTIQDFPLVDKLIKPFHPMRDKSFMRGNVFYEREKELDWVTGAFFLMRRDVVDNVGYFDKDYFMYMEEVDYCYRSKRKGWRVYYLPKWDITHIGGASSKSWSYVSPEFKGIKTFYKKHFPKWQYPVVRGLLKVGALGRVFLFGIIYGKEAANAYAKAFKQA